MCVYKYNNEYFAPKTVNFETKIDYIHCFGASKLDIKT